MTRSTAIVMFLVGMALAGCGSATQTTGDPSRQAPVTPQVTASTTTTTLPRIPETCDGPGRPSPCIPGEGLPELR